MATLITPPFRISFPSLFVATGYQDSAPKFSVTALWSVEDIKGRYKESWDAVVKALDKAARETFDTPLAKLPANIRRGIRNGNEKPHLNGYGEGILFASLSSPRKPQVVDLRKETIPDGDVMRIYPGAWARASVQAYGYDNIGKGVALGLNNLQWLGHGERLDSVTDAKQDFEADPADVWFQQDQAHAQATDEGSTATGAEPDPEIPDDDEIPF